MKPIIYSVSAEATHGVCKQSAVWASEGRGGWYPLFFLQRPKWIKSDSAWKKIVESVRMDLPKDMEIE